MSRALLFITVVATLLAVATPAQAYYNAGANGTAAMGAAMFNKIFADVIPVLEAVGPTIDVGPLDAKHYKIGKFHLSELDISSIAASFDAPNKLHLAINGLTIKIPSTYFSIFTHIFEEKAGPDFKISCSGHISGGTTGASAVIAIALDTDAQGKLTGTAASSAFDVGSVSVDIKMEHFLCKVGSDIIGLFKKAIIHLVEKEVNKLLPPKMKEIFQNLLNKDLPKLPLHFVSQPNVVSDHMELDVQLVKPSVGRLSGAGALVASGKRRRNAATEVQPHIFTDRDISIGISTQSLDDVISSATKKFNVEHEFSNKTNTSIFELLVPGAFSACPDCPFGIDFKFSPSNSPTVHFGNNAMQFGVKNALINFTAQHLAAPHAAVPLFSVYVDLQMGLTNWTVTTEGVNSTIDFQFVLNTLSLATAHSSVGPLKVAVLGSIVEDLLKNAVLPFLNKYFKGIPFDLSKDGFGLDQWKIDLNQDAISLGANLLLPKPTSPPHQGHRLKKF